MSISSPPLDQGRISNVSNVSSKTDVRLEKDFIANQEEYRCIVSSNVSTLVIEIEHKVTGDLWKGVFTAEIIENVTRKAKNFKKYSTFVTMICHALQKKSETVQMEFLTRTQIELVFGKKQLAPPSAPQNTTTRFLILTYKVEFDTIHYPLPLLFEHPSVERLKDIIRRLHIDLKQKSRKENTVALEITDQNEKLKQRIRSLEQTISQNGLDQSSSQLMENFEKMKREKHNLELAYEKLKRESSHEIKVIQNECEMMSSDLESQTIEMENLRRKLEAVSLNSKDTEVKSKLRSLSDKVAEQEKIIQRKNREIEQIKRDLSIARRTNSFTADDLRFNVKKNISPRREKPVTRYNSAPQSFKRFNPSEYIKNRQTKVLPKKTTSRPSSAEKKNHLYSSNDSIRATKPPRPDSKKKLIIPRTNSIGSTPPRIRTRSPSPKSLVDADELARKLKALMGPVDSRKKKKTSEKDSRTSSRSSFYSSDESDDRERQRTTARTKNKLRSKKPSGKNSDDEYRAQLRNALYSINESTDDDL